MKSKEDFGVVSFPIANNDYKVIDDGITNVYMIVYDEDSLTKISEYQTHLFLDGVFVADDCIKRPMLYKELTETSIDELVEEQMENDKYNNLYFPNFNSGDFEHNEIAKYLSIPLIASVRIGTCNMTFENNESPQYWNCNFDDLADKGKVIYKIFKEMYTDNEIRILTFVNNII